MAVAGMVLAVVALAMFGRIVDSTAELVRLLRMPSVPVTLVDSGADDAEEDAPFPSDASFEAIPLAPLPDDRRAQVIRRLDGNDVRTDSPDANDVSASQLASESQGAAQGAVVAGGVTPEPSPEAGHKDAASEPAEKPATPVRCGQRTCPEGQECCNWACSICVSPGETCSLSCGSPSLPVSAPCGPNTCNVSEICCNPSCGICVPAGGTCSKKPCEGMYLPVSPTCGMNTCNTGEICCNPSCGICKKPGEPCSQEPCP